MFGRPQKETKPSDPSDLLGVTLSSQPVKAKEKSEEEEIKLFDTPEEIVNEEQTELVNNVEKISKIISPYFIVIVGLFLYKDNFIVGTILIAIGLLSLLKISWKDIIVFFEQIKNLFSSTSQK
jgi:hypothetical protein